MAKGADDGHVPQGRCHVQHLLEVAREGVLSPARLGQARVPTSGSRCPPRAVALERTRDATCTASGISMERRERRALCVRPGWPREGGGRLRPLHFRHHPVGAQRRARHTKSMATGHTRKNYPRACAGGRRKQNALLGGRSQREHVTLARGHNERESVGTTLCNRAARCAAFRHSERAVLALWRIDSKRK